MKSFLTVLLALGMASPVSGQLGVQYATMGFAPSDDPHAKGVPLRGHGLRVPYMLTFTSPEAPIDVGLDLGVGLASHFGGEDGYEDAYDEATSETVWYSENAETLYLDLGLTLATATTAREA